MDAKSLIDLSKKDTTPSIEKLCDLIKPYKASIKLLDSLYDGLDVLKQFVQTLQENENDEVFLSCNTKPQQQLLE